MDRLENIRILQINSLQTIHNPKGKNAQIINRKAFGLSFCTEGRITYTLDGRQYVSDPEHAVFLPEGQTYTMHTDRAGSFPLINFRCTGLPRDRFVVVPIYSLAPYLRQFEQMQQLQLFHRNELKLLGIFYEVLSRLSKECGGADDPLVPALSYLESHLSDPELTNKVLAHQAGFSEVYFRRLFVRQYGISPRQYIMNIRMQKAKQLLADGSLSVTAVSERCGFSGVYHFSRCFRERVGVTPSEYARQNRSSNI